MQNLANAFCDFLCHILTLILMIFYPIAVLLMFLTCIAVYIAIAPIIIIAWIITKIAGEDV